MFRVEVTSVPYYLSSLQEPNVLVESTSPANEDRHVPLFLRAEKEEMPTIIEINIFREHIPAAFPPAKEDEKYKTELCKNFKKGHCRYETKCRFAHGEAELNFTEKHPRYKTIFCKNMEVTGRCNYNDRCKFAHSVKELNQHAPKKQINFKK